MERLLLSIPDSELVWARLNSLRTKLRVLEKENFHLRSACTCGRRLAGERASSADADGRRGAWTVMSEARDEARRRLLLEIANTLTERDDRRRMEEAKKTKS